MEAAYRVLEVLRAHAVIGREKKTTRDPSRRADFPDNDNNDSLAIVATTAIVETTYSTRIVYAASKIVSNATGVAGRSAHVLRQDSASPTISFSLMTDESERFPCSC